MISTRKELYIKEALLIQKHNPIINQQYNSFNEMLKLNSGNHFNSRSKQEFLNSNNNDIDSLSSEIEINSILLNFIQSKNRLKLALL